MQCAPLGLNAIELRLPVVRAFDAPPRLELHAVLELELRDSYHCLLCRRQAARCARSLQLSRRARAPAQVLAPGEAAARSPPLFWSLVWAARQGELAGALLSAPQGSAGEASVCLASAFEAVVAEADGDHSDET